MIRNRSSSFAITIVSNRDKQLEFWANLGWVALGLTMLYFGAEWLVKGSAEIAIKFGISPLVVGLTVVAFGTSAPELLVCLQANFYGQGDLAIGNIVGSNICNIAMVLGASAMIFPLTIHLQIIKREMAILLATSLLFVGMIYDGELSQVEGVILFVGIIAYVIFSVVQARRSPPSDLDETLSPEEIEAVIKGGNKRLKINVGLILLGMLFLFIGSERLVLGAEAIANSLGVPEAIIALSIVAFGTSLPELATGVMASWKKQGDIVVGNAIGSCIFNILAVGGLTASISPITSTQLNWIDLTVMLGTAAASWIMMRSDRSISRVEGAIMLAAYISYCFYLTTR
ncbi:calcium/sodium antiporter [bacterium]|nr:calcium/sodium antiporter [bacterium]